MFLQFVVNGLILGSIYALVSLGFALVYNATRVFHIAYASLYMIAPYLMITCFKTLGLPIIMSVAIAVLLTSLLSVFIEILIYKPLVQKNAALSIMMVSSIGVMIVVSNIIALIYGNETQIINQEISGTVDWGGILITHSQLYQLVFSAIVIAGFMVFIKYARLGIITRAMRDDAVLCSVFGIDVYQSRLLIFAISGGFAAIGSILIAWDVGMDPYVGLPMLLNAVVALVIGGIGKFVTPVFGGLILGLTQSVAVWAFSSRWQDVVTFSVLLIFVLLRPQGLFGERQRAV